MNRYRHGFIIKKFFAMNIMVQDIKQRKEYVVEQRENQNPMKNNDIVCGFRLER